MTRPSTLRHASGIQALADRLRPDLAHLQGMQEVQARAEVAAVIVTAPFFVAALVWLPAVSDWAQIPAHALELALLLGALLIAQRRKFTLDVGLGGGQAVALVGSLASLVLWVALLIFGPVAL